jgi:hypothetical protein
MKSQKGQPFRVAIEARASTAPTLSAGNHRAIKMLQPDLVLVVVPGQLAPYSLTEQIEVTSIQGAIEKIGRQM